MLLLFGRVDDSISLISIQFQTFVRYKKNNNISQKKRWCLNSKIHNTFIRLFFFYILPKW